MFFSKLGDLTGHSPDEKVRMIENHLHILEDELEYILTHLDSSNVIELDTAKTNIYKGEDNELQ
ncbi:MAG: hypothetical protein IJD91_05470 [Clostridia bacterium]|nr:hypothetical protein [Clostridia bacterium]